MANYATINSAFSAYRQSGVHQAGMLWAKDFWGIGQKGLGRALSVGFLGMSAISGWQEGGAWGAAKQLASDTAFAYGARAGLHVFGAPAVGVAGALAGFSAMHMLTSGESPLEYMTKAGTGQYMKKNASLELGGPINDSFGNIATMRQRSVNAIMNSRLNGRTALGQEAALTYRPYMR